MKRIMIALVAMLFSGATLAALNLNTATKDELVALPGIGPAKAQAIVDYRTQNGPFKSVDEIRKVKGIGEKLFLQIKPELAVGATSRSTLAQAPVKGDAKADTKADTKAPTRGNGGAIVKDEKARK
ncbi:MAG TPA: helix-hairpin-helix domain-containing protein [Casimicrobiaceae bacterium]|nr:helix-hairpin-helix domain-containing protein [Casimicrobiaceae bacterium]